MGFTLKVIYMFNGLITIAKMVSFNDGRPVVRECLAFVPGSQPGQTNLMEAFPFTDFDETITLQAGSFVTMTKLSDLQVIKAYEDGNKQVRAQRSGLVLP